jgi:S2P endopeptidase
LGEINEIFFLRYLAAFSFALAFFNAVPCYALDGQYILSAFVEYLSPSLFKRRRASILLGLIFGTCLLIINVSLAFARYFL